MKNAPLTARYRPQSFAEVAGQETIKTILSRAAAEDKVAPAYLFSGTRGVGKTTIARIFAKALNCRKAPAAEPCNECDLCRAVTQGAAIDVVEIDGASNRGIDDVRRLKEVVGYAPMDGRYKVFIIDEAHMLSRDAFNALLKTLEEPPAGVTFIMATTEPHKFPATVVSRCQHFVFKRLSEHELIDHLTNVLKAETIPFEAAAVRLIARRGAGSVRDSMSLLGQVLALGTDSLTQETTRTVLGLAGQETFMALLETIRQGNTLELVRLLRVFLEQGLDIGFFLRELANHWREMFILRQTGEAGLAAVDMPEDEARLMLDMGQKFSLPHIHACWQMTLEGQRRVQSSLEPGLALELLLLNLAMLPQLMPLDALSSLARRAQVPPQTAQAPSPVLSPVPSQAPAQGAAQPSEARGTAGDPSAGGEPRGESPAAVSSAPLAAANPTHLNTEAEPLNQTVPEQGQPEHGKQAGGSGQPEKPGKADDFSRADNLEGPEDFEQAEDFGQVDDFVQGESLEQAEDAEHVEHFGQAEHSSPGGGSVSLSFGVSATASSDASEFSGHAPRSNENGLSAATIIPLTERSVGGAPLNGVLGDAPRVATANDPVDSFPAFSGNDGENPFPMDGNEPLRNTVRTGANGAEAGGATSPVATVSATIADIEDEEDDEDNNDFSAPRVDAILPTWADIIARAQANEGMPWFGGLMQSISGVWEGKTLVLKADSDFSANKIAEPMTKKHLEGILQSMLGTVPPVRIDVVKETAVDSEAIKEAMYENPAFKDLEEILSVRIIDFGRIHK